MPRKIPASPDIRTELPFPLEGVDRTRSYQRQRPGTCVNAINVRTFDPTTGRARGGSRSGITKAIAAQPVGSYPIQDLNFLAADTTAPPTTSSVGQFIYSLASGSGFGMWNEISNVVIGSPLGVSAGYAMACSCWDSAGNVYVVMVATGTNPAPINIYKVSLTGSVVWINNSLTCTTASLRNVAGITVCGNFLFLARILGGSSFIDKINIADGTLSVTGWYTANATIVFSTSSVNCLGSIGTVLGVEFGYSAAPSFRLFNSLATSGATGLITSVAYGGVFANNISSVVSDGTNYFYTIASVSLNQVRQISLSGVAGWAASLAGSATPQCLCYDVSDGNLVVASSGGTYGVQALNLLTGSTLFGNSSLGTTWHSVDSDGQGNYVVQKNSVASNDVASIYEYFSGFSANWGPSTFANAVHYGASVNKAAVSVAGPASRNVIMLGVSNGEIFRFDSTQKYSIPGGPGALSFFSSVTFSAQDGTKMYFVDGTSYKVYDPQTGTISTWVASAGALPRDSQNNGATLIELWNGRIVMAGLNRDSQNYFMSKVADATNFNYGVTPATTTMAVAGNVSPLGLLGAPIQCMIPYQDNTMLFGLSHKIWLLQGDPQNGGSFVEVTDKIGMPFGRPWCKDPNGQIYFLSSRNGLFKITPGALPVRVSQQIEQMIEGITLSASIVRMEWDTQAQGFYLWVTPKAGGTGKNFFWDERVNAWWPDAYSSTGFNPNCVKAMDGDSPDDRRIFLGCQDGYIRKIDPNATTDDTLPIASFVYLGPIGTRDLDSITLKRMQEELSTSSNPVTFSVYVGKTAEMAYNSAPVMTGTWTSGHNPGTYIRWSGRAIYVKISCNSPWEHEMLRMIYKKDGLIRSWAY